MTHHQAIELYKDLKKVEGIKVEDISYKILKNIKMLSAEIEIFSEQEKGIVKLKADFEKEYEELTKPFSKNQSGNGIVTLDIPTEAKPKYAADLEKLCDKHKESIDKFDKEWLDLMEYRKKTESDFKPVMIKRALVPADINHDTYKLFFDLIED